MAYSLDLSGRVALVTGASSGLGAQFAQTLASAGAAVVLASRREERLKSLRIDIEAQGGQAHVVNLDVTNQHSIEAAVEQAEAEVGPIDILINNSGVSATQRLQDVQEEDFDFIFNTNVRGAFFVAQAVGKRMLARSKGVLPGTYAGGRIINIASAAALRVLPQIGVYCMSKAAVVQMTKAMAIEWGRYGINVNAICPGFVATEMVKGLPTIFSICKVDDKIFIYNDNIITEIDNSLFNKLLEKNNRCYMVVYELRN
jgi:NAD(P)-dependent dehydrogenase (short-subunit alcohol dehydrogenase family)